MLFGKLVEGQATVQRITVDADVESDVSTSNIGMLAGFTQIILDVNHAYF